MMNTDWINEGGDESIMIDRPMVLVIGVVLVGMDGGNWLVRSKL